MNKRPLAPVKPKSPKRPDPGRPPLSETEASVRFNVITPASLYAYAALIADGNVSAGVRAALEYHRDCAGPLAAFVAAFDEWIEVNDLDVFNDLLAARRAVKL